MRKLLFLGIAIFLATQLATASASPEKLPRTFFGIMSQENPSLQDTRKMFSGGIGAYRIPMSWDSVQSGTTFQWGWVDETMRNLSVAGIRALPIMMGTPKSLGKDFRELPIQTKEQRQGWAEYLQAAINRYGPGGSFWQENPDLAYRPIRTWQIWNEANFVWFTDPVSPQAYSTLLRNSAQVIQSEDPGAKIMLASLFAKPEAGQGQDSVAFLRQLYRLGAARHFQSVALHPYSRNTKEMARMIGRFRMTLDRSGDRRKWMHLTEIGWGSGTATAFDKGSAKAQAQELRNAYRYLIENRKQLRIGSVYWFSWKDLPRNVQSCDFCYHSGLFLAGQSLRPKPAWHAFRSIAN